jgi:hypothetical protein
MNEFFASLGADLRDRRFLPILVVLGVALLAAVAWAALGGGSSTGTPPAAVTATGGASAGTGMTITEAPATAPKQALAETTSGAPRQKGTPRNPFKPLPGAEKESSSSRSGATVTSSKGAASSGGTTPESNGTSSTPTGSPTESQPSTKPRYYIHYHVTAEFGVVPEPEEGSEESAPAQLTTYKNMRLNEALPSKQAPQLVFLGVVLKTGDTAVFALTGETILHGPAACKPSATQCKAIELKAGQAETLEVVGATGQVVTYELKVSSIEKSQTAATTARARAASKAIAKAAAKIDRNKALKRSRLRFSVTLGGLVFVARPALTAHDARHH